MLGIQAVRCVVVAFKDGYVFANAGRTMFKPPWGLASSDGDVEAWKLMLDDAQD